MTREGLTGSGDKAHGVLHILRGRGRAVLAIGALLFICGGALLTLPYADAWYNVQDVEHGIRQPPAFQPRVGFALYGNSAPPDYPSWATRFAFRAVSWMGHDNLGRSLFYRVMPALLISLSIGLAAALIAVLFGGTWGAVAALIGGRVDNLMMRVVDVLYGLPYILMVILLKVGLTRPLTHLFGGWSRLADVAILFMAIGAVSWLTMARVVRGQVLSLRSQPFFEAARAMGAGPVHILLRHVVPNLVGPVITYAALVIPQAILQEAFLSFLGIGIQPPTPSLGQLAAEGVNAVNSFVSFWWLLAFPCGMLVVMLLSLNFIGDALRDAFDPKSRESTLV